MIMWHVDIKLNERTIRKTFETEADAREFYAFMKASAAMPMILSLINATEQEIVALAQPPLNPGA